MSDLEPDRNGRTGTSEGTGSGVRWGLLFSIAIHAVIIAPLLVFYAPNVYHPPASQMDVPSIDIVETAQMVPETSSDASAMSTSKTAAETSSMPAGEVSADMPLPEPIPNAVSKSDPQPAVDTPPSKPPRRPPVKPVPAKVARAKPVQARTNQVEEAKDNPSPLSLIGSAASAAVPSFRSSQSAGEPPSPAAIEYGRIVRSHVNQNRIYPQQDRSTPIFGTAVVHFFLLPDGRLKNVEIVHSSGNDIIDRVAIESIQRATPFPPVPPNVATEMMDVTVYMRY